MTKIKQIGKFTRGKNITKMLAHKDSAGGGSGVLCKAQVQWNLSDKRFNLI
jgi:hypothetical protein